MKKKKKTSLTVRRVSCLTRLTRKWENLKNQNPMIFFWFLKWVKIVKSEDWTRNPNRRNGGTGTLAGPHSTRPPSGHRTPHARPPATALRTPDRCDCQMPTIRAIRPDRPFPFSNFSPCLALSSFYAIPTISANCQGLVSDFPLSPLPLFFNFSFAYIVDHLRFHFPRL